MTFILTLDKTPTSAITLNYETIGTGSATPGDDFVESAGTVSFAAGQKTATINIMVRGDKVVEAAETVQVRITGGDLKATAVATGTVTNDDSAIGAVSDSNPAANSVEENSAIGTEVGVTALAIDPDAGSIVTYTLTSNPGNKFAINAATGVVTVAGALDHETAESHAVTVQATSNDGTSRSAVFNIAVANVNDLPMSAVVDSQAAVNTVAENAAVGTLVGITANATDADSDATVSYSLSDSAGGKFAINASTGAVSVAGPLDFETASSHSITVLASSSDGSTNSQTFSIAVTNVNDNPVSTVDDSNAAANTVAENSSVGTVVGVTALATDADVGASVTYSLSDNAGGKFAINPTTGVVTVAGALDFETASSHSITVLATSSDGSTNSQAFTVAVTNVNEAPVSAATATVTMLENSADVAIFTATDVDAGDVRTYSLSGADAGKFNINTSTGQVVFAAAPNFEAPASAANSNAYSFNVVATDAGGLSSTQAVTVHVNNVNEAPVAVADGAPTVIKGNPLTLNVLANDTDVDAGQTITLTGTPTASIGTVSIVNGQLQYVAPSNYEGNATISYTISDGQTTVSATQNITVLEPQLTAASASVNEGTAIVYTLKGVPNTTYQVKVTGNNIAEVGDTSATYTTDANGVATITVATNADRSTEVAAQSVSAKIVGTLAAATIVAVADSSLNNIAPVAQVATQTVAEGAAALTGQLVATDADDAAAALSFSTNSVVPGFVLNANGSYSFDPTVAAYNTLAAGQTSVQTVTYTVTDNAAGALGALTDTKTLTITVTGTNDVPVAAAAVNAANEAAAPINGNVVATDADAGETATLVYSAAAGQAAIAGLTFNANGSYSFNPAHAAYDSLRAGQVQVLSYNYTATDAQGTSSNSTLTITVTGTNDAPVASVVPAQTAKQDVAYSLDVTRFFSDVDVGDATNTTYVVQGLPAGAGAGLKYDPTSKTITGTPLLADVEGAANGVYAVTIIATDPNGVATAALQFNLTVQPAYTVAGTSITNVNEGATVTYTVTNASRAFGDILNYTIVPGTATTTAADFRDGLTGQAVFNEKGQAQVTISVTADQLTEAVAESFSVDFDLGGPAVVRSATRTAPVITINDTSQTGDLNRTLTTGANSGVNFTLGVGNDTFDGRTTPDTLNTSDVLDGGTSGNDIVTASLSIANATVRPTLKNIDVVDVTATQAGITVDLANTDADLKWLKSTQSTNTGANGLTFNNINNAASLGIVLNSQQVNANYTAAAMNGATTVTVDLDNVTDGGGNGSTVNLAGVAGAIGAIETVTVNSNVGGPSNTGTTNTVTVNNATFANGAYTLNLTGSAAVDVAGTNATTINAAAATGPVEFTGTAAAYTYAGSATAADTLRVNAGQTVTNITNTETITLNGGTTVTVAAADATNVTVNDLDNTNDVITLANGADTVNLGGGFDSVNVGGGATNRVAMNSGSLDGTGPLGGADDDTIIGGAGVDTLALWDDGAGGIGVPTAVADAQFVGVSGFEVLALQVNNANAPTQGNLSPVLDTNALTDTVNAATVQGIHTIIGTSGADAGNQAFDNAITLEEQAINLTLTIDGGEDNDTGAVANLNADNDTVTVQDSGAASAGSFTLNIQNIEQVTHNATGTLLTVNVTGGTQGVVVVGSADQDSVTGGAGADTLQTGNNGGAADFFDGQGGLDVLTAQGGATNFRNVETVTIAIGTPSTLTEVAGGTTVNVTVTDNDAGNSIVVLLGGNDTVHAGVGADSITLGEGTNRVNIVTANLTEGAAGARDTIAGGTGQDTLSLTGGANAAPTDDAKFAGVTSMEVLDLQTTTSIRLGATALAAAVGIAQINGASGVNNAADNTIQLESIALNKTLTIDGGEDIDAVNDVANLNVDVDTVTVLNTGVLTTLQSGNFTLNVSNVEEVNAAAAADAITITASGAQATNITGSAFNDTITGGNGNDTLMGGNGKDNLAGGAGNDIYVMTGVQFNTDQDVVTEAAGGGNDTLRVTTANDNVNTVMPDVGFNGRFMNVEVLEVQGIGNLDPEIFQVDLGAYANQTQVRTVSAGLNALLKVNVNNDITAAVTINGGLGIDMVNNHNRVTGAAEEQLEAAITASDITYLEVGLGNGNDTIYSGAGNDTITLTSGNNTVKTNSGTDTITLGVGVDTVDAGAGNDTVHGGANVTSDLLSRDVLVGGAGSDVLNLAGVYTAGTALTADNLISGFETIVLASQPDAVGANNGFQYSIVVDDNNDVLAGVTTDVLTVNAATLKLDADADTPNVNESETLNFSAAGTTLFAVNVQGGNANDTIVGSTLADTLNGGAGNDTITGGAGNDVLTGGTGNDEFRLGVNLAAIGLDTITDFRVAPAPAAPAVENDVIFIAAALQDGGAGGDDFDASNIRTMTTDLTLATGNLYAIVDGAATLNLGNIKSAVNGATGTTGEILITNDASAYVLRAAENTSTVFELYRVFDADTVTVGVVVPAAEKMGTITLAAGTFGDLTTANFTQ